MKGTLLRGRVDIPILDLQTGYDLLPFEMEYVRLQEAGFVFHVRHASPERGWSENNLWGYRVVI